jgi:fructokinase
MGIEKKYDVTALGELLIDFVQYGISDQGNNVFEANPGGAPCNVLAMLTKAGAKTAFIGKVGNDMFGRMLKERAGGEGIDLTGLMMDDEVHTTLAFVEKLPNGDRDFSFYRKPGADIMLTKDEVEAHADLIEGAKIFHLGTLSMTDEEVEKATKAAMKIAKKAGCIISFDPNLRPPLWESLSEAKAQMHWGLSQSDVVKLADNEIVYIEAFGRDIEVHTLSETYFAQERMYQLEEHLDSRTFIRVSKSVIISRNHVKKIRPSLSMKFILTMSDGTLVDVTRSYYSEFRRFFHI